MIFRKIVREGKVLVDGKFTYIPANDWAEESFEKLPTKYKDFIMYNAIYLDVDMYCNGTLTASGNLAELLYAQQFFDGEYGYLDDYMYLMNNNYFEDDNEYGHWIIEVVGRR